MLFKSPSFAPPPAGSSTGSSSGRFALAVLAVAVSAACGSALAQGASARATELSQGYATGRILVMPKPGLPDAVLSKVLREHGGVRERRAGSGGLRIVDLPPGLEKQAVERLARHPHFKFAELDRIVAPAGATNDPYYGSAWHIERIGAHLAWDTSMGSGVKIAILDTGVDAAHPDLRDRMLPGFNFYDNNTNTSDVQGHGTGVSGAAAATLNNGLGVAAVAGRASIIPVRISAPDGYALWSTVAQALTWSADQGAKVANISFVGVADSAAVRSAADYMRSKGGLVVVAAGNNNRDEGIVRSPSMIPVSATDANDQKASFSSWGNFVAMAAPGVDIWTTVRGGSYQRWQGTSLASPVTAAVVALMMARNPGLPGAQVEQILYDTAVDLGSPGRDAVFGYGRVNAAAAVAAASEATSNVDSLPPTASITSPWANSTVSGVVPVSVTASDNVGIARVDLLAAGRVVASDSVAPFGFSWDTTATPNGMAQLVAVAFDAAGNSASSSAVAVNVANSTAVDTLPPLVTINEPVHGSRVSGSVRVRVTASDNAGAAGIRHELRINGTRMATATGSVLSYTWNTKRVKPGSYTIEAMASDAAGNITRSSVTVTR